MRLTFKERAELLKLLDAECDDIMNAKGPGYTLEGFANDNFWVEGKELGIRPEQALALHMSKHSNSIKVYIKNDGKVVDPEPIEFRIKDHINYLRILWSILVEQGRIIDPRVNKYE